MARKLTLDEINARLAERGFELAGPYVDTTQKPTPLRCSHGHQWNARINNVLNGGSGCPHCSRKALRTVEDIGARLAERGFELAGPYVGTTQKPTALRCAEGHQWNARLSSVLNKDTGCPHCSGKAPLTIEEIEHHLEERGFELAGPYVGTTKKPTPLRCAEGHEWNVRLASVLKNGTGCPHCSGNARVTVEEIEHHLEDRGFELAGPYVGMTHKPTPLRCQTCDHVWKTSIHNIFQGTGCPACKKDPWRTQSIYHLHHPDIPHAYIGISTKPLVRLEEHQKYDGPRGELARSIDEPELLTNADVFALYESAWEEDQLPETIANWFESNPHGKLPPGRLWFADDWFTMDAKTKTQPAKVPRFVAEWVESEMIRAISENFPAPTNPFLQAGKVPLVNIAKNNVAAISC